MFTELEGTTWDEVLRRVKRATEAVLPFGSRVSLVLKADIRPGYEARSTRSLGGWRQRSRSRTTKPTRDPPVRCLGHGGGRLLRLDI